MIIRTLKPLVVLSLVVALLGTVNIHAAASGQDKADIFAAASDAIDAGEFDSALKKLGDVQPGGLTDSDLGWLNFLKGKAKYLKTAKDIRACREAGTQEPGDLQDHQVEPLREALNHFLTAYDKAPESVWAPEALYAAAMVQDYGCLQRFEEAAETYKEVFKKYPDTHLGLRAQERYNILKAGFDGKGHTTFH